MRKRKILSILLSLCVILAFMPQMAFAETTEDGQFQYTVTDGKATITKYNGSALEVTIPKVIEIDSNTEYPVTAIGEEAFQYKTSVSVVTIQEGVTSIGNFAFIGCSGLDKVTIPSSVTSIENKTFQYCSGLKSITIPSSVTSIENYAFKGCTGLTSITIPASVTLIGKYAFDGCTGLTSITIPASVSSIGINIFKECTGLTSIEVDDSNTSYSSKDGVLFTKDKAQLIQYPLGNLNKSYNIPESVTGISPNAFSGCTSLESITISGSVTSISNAFSGCKSLKSVAITGKVASIGEFAFNNCTNLTNINIPNGATSIGRQAFYDCANLARIDIPASVTSIGDFAFYGCTGLTSITIPSSVISIGNNAFEGCTGLESIFLPDDLDASNANIPDTTTKVRYSLDTGNDKVTITGITLGTGKTSVAIPATICGYPVVAISDASLLEKISSHTCAGGTATCQTKATCGICEQEYGNYADHTLTKTEAKVPTYTEAGYKEYWQCSDCKKYFSDVAGTTEISNLESWKTGEGKIDKLPMPVKTDSVTIAKDGSVTVTLNKSITTSDSKTTATVTDTVADQILAKLASSESKSVVIDASAGSAEATQLVISESAMKKLAEVEGIEITLVTDSGRVVLDNKTIAAVAASAGNDGQVTLNIETVEKSNNLLKVDISISTSSGYVTDFSGGKVTVTVVIDDELKGKNPACVYIDDEGKYYKLGGTLNEDGTFTFVTGHFSTYAIMPEADADKVIKDQAISAVKSIKTTVTLSTKSVKKGIKVSVKIPASQKADKTGIIIYRSTKRSSGYAMYKKVKTSGSTYTITNIKNVKGNRLVKGKRYYYKARVYKVIDGKTYYGPMSSVKYIKAK